MLLIIWASLNRFYSNGECQRMAVFMWKRWNNVTHDTHNWVRLAKAKNEGWLLESGKSSQNGCVLGSFVFEHEWKVEVNRDPRTKNLPQNGGSNVCGIIANSFFSSHLILWKQCFHSIWITHTYVVRNENLAFTKYVKKDFNFQSFIHSFSKV